MKAFKRWIALAPVAMMLLAGLPGCKTGMKRFACQQTSCSSQTACGGASSSGCLGQKTSCGSTAGCTCKTEGKSCLCQGAACGCKTACAASGCDKTSCGSMGCLSNGKAGCLGNGCQTQCGQTSGCKSDCLTSSNSKVSCASMGCVSNGKISCGSVCATITPGKAIPAEQPAEKPAEKPAYETAIPPQVNPFELESNILPQETPEDEQAFPIQEQPFEEEKADEFPFPPSPVTKSPAKERTGNPFLRVSQTREVRSPAKVAAAQDPEAKLLSEWQSQPGDFQEFSEAWSDALGLPSKGTEPAVAPYLGDR